MIYTPKNTRFNRQANLLEKTIQLLERRNGLAYFAVLNDQGEYTYWLCEEGVFDKEFSPSTGTDVPFREKIVNIESVDITKIDFKRYPTDLK